MPVIHRGRWCVVFGFAIVCLGQSAEALATGEAARRLVPAARIAAPPVQPELQPEAVGRRLIEAVKRGDTAAVRALLRQRVDVNTPEVDGTTALHWAVHRDDVETVDLLLGAGADVAAANRYGVVPLSLACLNGSAVIVETLLDAGADPNATQSGGETALMTAARTGVVEPVRLLLDAGADANATESLKGQTALMWAAAENHAATIDTLVEAGADSNARSRPSPDLSRHEPGDLGFTALLFAARAGQLDAVRALLAAGVDVNDPASDGTSALVLAVASGQFQMAAFLLDNGADPDAAAQGWTPLHQIAWTRRPNQGNNTVGPVVRGRMDSLSLVEKLVAHGADVHARMTKEIPTIYSGRNRLNRIGATPFLVAAHRVDVELMRLLAESGADPLLPNEEGTTPVMVAAGVGLWWPGESPGTPEESAEAVKLVLALGGDPTTVDANGDTALHGAAHWGSPDAVEMLVAAGAKLDLKNERGWTPLRIADGVAVTGGGIQLAPAVADLLRQMRRERGLPVPEPVPVGVGR